MVGVGDGPKHQIDLVRARGPETFGMGELTVTRIVGHAGVSRRTFYEQFSGCEECVAALFEDALARVRQAVQDALTTDGDARRARGLLRGRLR